MSKVCSEISEVFIPYLIFQSVIVKFYMNVIAIKGTVQTSRYRRVELNCI